MGILELNFERIVDITILNSTLSSTLCVVDLDIISEKMHLKSIPKKFGQRIKKKILT